MALPLRYLALASLCHLADRLAEAFPRSKPGIPPIHASFHPCQWAGLPAKREARTEMAIPQRRQCTGGGYHYP